MSKTVVSSDNAPAAIGPYSPGIQTGNMVFLSGQLGIDPATGKLPEGVEAQAKQSLANVEALLTAARRPPLPMSSRPRSTWPTSPTLPP